MPITPELKMALHARCCTLVEDRIAAARTAMEEAQAAANENTKSSAGDKYETGRAMMQIERDKAAAQLAQSAQLKQALDGIDPAQVHSRVGLGSLVETPQGIFFLSAAIGKVELAEQTYWAISPVSPVGKLMKGKLAGETVTFNGRTFALLAVG
ncbi:MAG: 3-oxoacyl-ACP synthase [Bacteroidota bacterium]